MPSAPTFTTSLPSPTRAGRPDLSLPRQQVVLLLVLLFEVAIFGVLAENFWSAANLLTVARRSVDLGLIALALTPVILTGGIDLSVGSLVGLCAVAFGMLWHDAGLPPWLAGTLTLGVAGLAGGLNALLVTRGRIPPLIVTLGTFSLFRGLAEGLLGRQGSFSDLPASFAFLGQGSVLGVPTQLWLFVPAAACFFLLVHRSTSGRALSAIGYSADGARHAGIRVGRLTASAYVLSGLCAGVAGLIQVAWAGEARANAGTGYELAAVTAVVLGGTSIFGGRGSVPGTLLGLTAIALLTNGLRLARLPEPVVGWLGLASDRVPAELAGVFTGLLLLAAIGLDALPAGRASPRDRDAAGAAAAGRGASEELDMRNSQLAVLCAVIVAAALIVAGGNLMVVNALKSHAGGGASASPVPGGGGGGSPGAPAGKRLVVACMPKSKGNAYFIACGKGAEEAARELNVDLRWDGPTSARPTEQNEIVEDWINDKVDVIAVAVENGGSLSPALKRAREAGIKVVTWDADADKGARDFFCNQATPQGIGDMLFDTGSAQMGGEGTFVIISGTQTATNLGLYRDRILERLKEPAAAKLRCAEVVYCDDKQGVATDLAKQMLNKHKDLKLIMAICSPGVPGSAEAVKQLARSDVRVIGLGLPNENKKYVHEGVTQAVILWNTADLGYLAVHAAKAVRDGSLKPGATTFDAGRLKGLSIEGTDIILGKPVVFTRENIDKFDF